MLERLFALQAHGTTGAREAVAGLTTFAAMAYILAVNPEILAQTGMDRGSLVVATAVAAALGCFLMAALANYPIALAPGMGTNAYFAFIVVLGMGVPWPSALGLVFWNGLIFLVLSVSGLRTRVAQCLPGAIQTGIQAGIGLFIALLGFKAAGIVVADPATMVTGGDIFRPTALLALVGLVAMVVLTARRVPGAIILVIIALTLAGLFVHEGDGRVTSAPETITAWPAHGATTFFALDFWFPWREPLQALPVIMILLMLDFFDSLGTIIGVSRRAQLVGPDGTLPKMGRALSADALATMGGALCGTSTTTSYVESAAGIEAGGRTGMTSVVVGVCFLIALFFAPLISAVPAAATAPALIMVGILMAEALHELKGEMLETWAPALLTALLIPLTFSITHGIALGLLAYLAIAVCTCRARQVPALTYAVGAIFLVFYVLEQWGG